MSAILVPAFPAVLRDGLPVIDSIDGERGMAQQRRSDWYTLVWSEADGSDMHRLVPSEFRLDLRDPTVRDAVVRALWRKLRPDEPEPLTAPTWRYPWTTGGWHPTTPGLRPRWTLGDVGFDARPFDVQHPDDRSQHVIPALASIPLDSPDRDLLALAEVAKAVLGAS